MDTVFARVAGLDVHLKTIQCAVRCRQESGKLLAQIRSFGTMTRDLRALADYLHALGVTHVALEATGVLWSVRIGHRLGELLPGGVQTRLDSIPGVNCTTIENVLAETGVDMTVFPDEHHLSSWCGICPGNEESAGKRLRSRTRKGNRWLRRALAEAAWAASHTKATYLATQYRRLAARRGKKRALIAVGHSLLVIIYHVLRHHVEYKDLGPDYFDRLEPERLKRYLVRRLHTLGYNVTLEPKSPDDCAA